jgi:hypothetical protein
MTTVSRLYRFGFFGLILVGTAIGATHSYAAYPIVDAVAGLPYPELITVYPDDTDKNLYYFVPTSLSFVYEKKADGSLRPRLGVQYWGISGSDVDGAGGNFAFSVQPSIDKDKVNGVVTELKKANPNARFAYPTLVSSKMELIINGNLVAENQDKTTATSASGGTVDATQGFAIGLSRLGARIFAQGAAADSDVFAARYTYKFTGIAKRLHAKITIYDRRVYDHFKVTASASAWWGMVKSSWAADWQKLVTDGAIKLEYLEGGDTDGDNYMLEVFKIIVSARVNQEGMFKPELKPGGLPTAESQNFGWGFSSSAAWEHLEETHNFTIELNKAKLEDREFNIGLSFNAVCAKYPDSFADITRPPQKCLDKNNFATILKDVQACIRGKLTFFKSLLDQSLINQATYDAKAAKVLEEVCYKDEISPQVVNGISSAFAPVLEGLNNGKLQAADAEAIVSHWVNHPNAITTPEGQNSIRSLTDVIISGKVQ